MAAPPTALPPAGDAVSESQPAEKAAHFKGDLRHLIDLTRALMDVVHDAIDEFRGW